MIARHELGFQRSDRWLAEALGTRMCAPGAVPAISETSASRSCSSRARSFASGACASIATVSKDSRTGLVLGVQLAFPPEAAAHLVKLACELPDKADRSLSLWTCGQLAIHLTSDGMVDSIAPQSVQRSLQSSKLKPWRVHYRLSPKVAHDETFRTWSATFSPSSSSGASKLTRSAGRSVPSTRCSRRSTRCFRWPRSMDLEPEPEPEPEESVQPGRHAADRWAWSPC
jgi:hypothetical protein